MSVSSVSSTVESGTSSSGGRVVELVKTTPAIVVAASESIPIVTADSHLVIGPICMSRKA
jgi:hypothetical protein